jgi:hypothetical protein
MAINDKQRASVLQALERGDSLRKACREADISRPSDVLDCANPERPQYIPGFDVQYTRARTMGYEMRGDSLLDTAEDMSIDPAHKRIIVDTLKWELSKMLPKYADRSDVNLTGKLEHAHTGPVSDATRSIIETISAGSASLGDAAPVQD